MTITLPSELDPVLIAEADRAGVSPDEMVRRALLWYLEMPGEVWQELADWQRAGALSWLAVEESVK